LRVYVGCASVLYGDIRQADVVKVHKASGKVTFLVYDHFFGKPLPELQQRVKVNLRTRCVQVFDHSGSGQLLYFKERFVSEDHPSRKQMEKFSAKLAKLNIIDANGLMPNKSEFEAMLERKRLNKNLNKVRKKAG